jgi:glucokinase
MSDRVLVGDFGGTNARVALVDSTSAPFAIRNYPSNDFATGTAVIERYLSDVGRATADTVRGCCIAIAGPVDAGRGKLTNGRIACDAREIEVALAFEHALVINDFTAVGHALPGLPDSAWRTIGPELHGVGTIAAIGPGTGLGMGFVAPDRRGWRVLPSEGGHANLAPSDPLEVEVLGHLMQRFDFVGWETVLSGPGLVNLYRAVCDVWGTAPAVDDPSAITARAIAIEDPVCHQTLEVFCNLLGTAAGGLAMTVCATGGVYIAGGIVPRIADFVAQSQFRRRFDARGPMSYYVNAIPTRLVLEADLGLLGAAAAYRSAHS